MGVLQIIDQSGDTKLEWDVMVAETVECSREEFERLLTDGYMAVKIQLTDGVQEKTMIRDFDETAERIIMLPRVAGG